MAYDFILTEKEDGVAILTLNRPEKLNAMNRQLNRELQEAVRAMNADAEVGCIVITGAGERAFSAGGDIHEQRERDQETDQESRREQDERRSRGTYEISASLKPVIGMMNGLAYGGAAVLSSSLDIRIGCERSSFRFLAAAYGRINSTWTLPNQVGWPIAKELLFTGRVVDAEEAHRIGLLNHLVPAAELRAKTMEVGRAIAGNRRESVMGIKELLLLHQGCNLEQQWANERDFTTHRVRGYNAEQAFPEFIARKGREIRPERQATGETALFMNGIFRVVLDEVADAQAQHPGQILFLQPYAGRPIKILRDNIPSPEAPVTLYASTSDDMTKVAYTGEVVGWEDKTTMNAARREEVIAVMRQYQPKYQGPFNDPELYNLGADGKTSPNLLHIRNLVKVDPPFSVTQLIKDSDGFPLAANRSRGGGWSYVHKPV